MMDRIFPDHTTHKYIVRIDGVNLAVFRECTLPSLEVETLPVKEGGLNAYVHTLPVRVSAGKIKLKSGIIVGDELLQWYLQMVNGNVSAAMRTVSITVMSVANVGISTWWLSDAYPTRWNGPTLTAEQAALAVEEIELAYHAFEVE